MNYANPGQAVEIIVNPAEGSRIKDKSLHVTYKTDAAEADEVILPDKNGKYFFTVPEKVTAPVGTDEALTQEVLAWYKPYYDAHCQIKTRPYDGILPLLRRLRAAGLRLAVISNKPDPAVALLAQEHFAGLLDLAVGETARLRRKPWPDMVEEACARLGLRKERCLYVGDSEVDVLTARNAGLDCASVCWGFRSRKELENAGAAHLFESPEALGDWILERGK